VRVIEEPIDCPECGAAGAMLHPYIPLRFSDVIQELQSIAELATADVGVRGSAVAAACRRAESLLMVLRKQFVNDIEVGTTPATTGHSSSRGDLPRTEEHSRFVHPGASVGSDHPDSVGFVDAHSLRAEQPRSRPRLPREGVRGSSAFPPPLRLEAPPEDQGRG
jgi:hypothetical protein